MANPVIDSVTPAGPIAANTGDKVKLTVVAHDDDSHTGSVRLVVTDSAGNKSQPVTVPIQWTDGLTLSATTDDGTPVSVSGMVVTVG
jgi:hypothetical protein